VAVEPDELGEAGEVADDFGVGARGLELGDPADVRVPEAALGRRVHVPGQIGELVVVPVVGGPPEDALLAGGLGEEGEDELEDAAGLEGAVREVAVVAGHHAEGADEVEDAAEDPVDRAGAGPQGGERGDVHQQEGGEADPVHAAVGRGEREMGEPLGDGDRRLHAGRASQSRGPDAGLDAVTVWSSSEASDA
jgi:hypothetical protein